MPNVNFLSRMGEEITENIRTFEECQDICEKRDACTNFVWYHGNAGQWSYQCVTMTGSPEPVTDTYCVSGTIYDSCDQSPGEHYHTYK